MVIFWLPHWIILTVLILCHVRWEQSWANRYSPCYLNSASMTMMQIFSVRGWRQSVSFSITIEILFFCMLMRWTIVFTLRPFVILRLKRVSDNSYQIDSRWSLEMYNQIKTQNKEKGYSKNMKYWPDEWFGGRTCREQDQGMERMGGGGERVGGGSLS